MTNHIHLVISQFWQQDNHPLILTAAASYSKALEYIHYNPVTSGMVDEPTDYPWSSARDYTGERGLRPIEFL